MSCCGEEDGVQVARGALSRVGEALADLASNRLPLAQTKRVHRARKVVEEPGQETEELRRDLVLQHKPEGREIAPEDEGYDELLGKITELMSETVAIDVGEPIHLNGDADVKLSAESYSLLVQIGLLEDDAE